MKKLKEIDLFSCILLYLMEIPVWLLIVPFFSEVSSAVVPTMCIGGLCWGTFCTMALRRGFRPGFQRLKHPASALAACLFFGICTYDQWSMMHLTARIAAHLPLNVSQFILAATVIHMLLAIPGMDVLISALLKNVPETAPGQKSKGAYWGMFLGSALILLLTSRSSPLYPINPWGDANIYFTMGKSMGYGKVIYRDLFDHKGPLLYMLHWLASLISFKSFFGVYLLEVLTCFGTLVCFYRILAPRLGEGSWKAIVLAAALLYTLPCFSLGDSAEEFCLPMLTFGVYVGIRTLEEKRLPGRWESFAIGLTSGVVLWTKFTMVAFYIGWIIAPLVLAIREKKLRAFFGRICWIALGVGTVTLIPLFYFAICGGFRDFWDVYIIGNVFDYKGGKGTVLECLKNGFDIFTNSGFFILILGILGGLWVSFREKPYVRIFYFSLWAVFASLTWILGNTYIYYSFALVSLAVFGIAWLNRLTDRLPWPAVAAMSLVLTLIMSSNFPASRVAKEDQPQIHFAEIIAESGIENPTLLNYGRLDGGFYLAAGIVPETRSFCVTNLRSQESIQAQQAYIREEGPDFIATWDLTVDEENYVLISEMETDQCYRLYQKIG